MADDTPGRSVASGSGRLSGAPGHGQPLKDLDRYGRLPPLGSEAGFEPQRDCLPVAIEGSSTIAVFEER